MDKNQLIETSGNALLDVLSLLGLPTSVATQLLRSYVEKRVDEARNIFLKEIKEANVSVYDVVSEDDLLSCIYRYGIAVRDNAGRSNLFLLAQAFRGMLERHRLYTDDFDKYSNAISSLTRDEIFILGRLHYFKLEEIKNNGAGAQILTYWGKCIGDLVPSTFPSKEYVQALVCAAQRSGLVLYGDSIDGGDYGTSPLMDELYELTDFQEALRAYPRK